MVRGKLARRHNLAEEGSSRQLRLEVPQLDIPSWNANQKPAPQNGGTSGKTF